MKLLPSKKYALTYQNPVDDTWSILKRYWTWGAAVDAYQAAIGHYTDDHLDFWPMTVENALEAINANSK